MTDLIGQTIGNYQIESLLGTGGMGQVFRAEHRFLNRSAAVKVMHVHLAADESFQSRFLHEAQSSSDLNHPNIVQIYDFGQEGGRYYLVMELMQHGSLRTALREQHGKLPSWSLATGVELIHQAAEALAYAHSRGMIHRDVKPDNLLLGFSADDVSANIKRDEPVVKICDFGLARLMEGQHLTASGVMMGTPAYMSPEQCQGHPIDGRSDIYSLGVVLYEVLTGSPPFKTSQPSEAIYKHVYVEPPPPRSIRPELSPELEAIVLRCLAKRPEDRFASATELATALSATPTEWGARPLFPTSPPAGEQNGTTVVHDRGTPATVSHVETAAAAPQFPTLTSDQRVPLLHLTDASGQTRAVFELTAAGATIGRSDDNVISIEDAGISRHHARIDWDGRQATATDLHSTNGTSIGDVSLIPGQSATWDGHEPLRIGKHWLRLALPEPATTQQPMPVAAFVTSQAEALLGAVTVVPQATARLSLELDRPTLDIQPGEPAVVQAIVSNDGDAADSVEVVVDGVPREWVTPSANAIELQPGSASTVELVVNVPASPPARDGEYRVIVLARSLTSPSVVNVAEASWRVAPPMIAPGLRLLPATARGRERGEYQVSVAATETPTHYRLSARNGGAPLAFAFNPPELEASPGQPAIATLTIDARSRSFGRTTSHPFEVVAEATTSDERRQASGVFQQTALVPLWIPALVAVALIGAALALSGLFGGGASAAPTIESLWIEPEKPLPGQPVTIKWTATDAETIDIEGIADGIDASLGRFTVEGGFDGPTDLTITAANDEGSTEKSLAVAFADETPTATGTSVATEASTATETSPATATGEAQRTPLPTRPSISVPTRTPTATATASPTATPPPTNTPVPPPTNTPVPPPTNTPVPPPTNTPVPPPPPPPTNTPVPPPPTPVPPTPTEPGPIYPTPTPTEPGPSL